MIGPERLKQKGEKITRKASGKETRKGPGKETRKKPRGEKQEKASGRETKKSPGERNQKEPWAYALWPFYRPPDRPCGGRVAARLPTSGRTRRVPWRRHHGGGPDGRVRVLGSMTRLWGYLHVFSRSKLHYIFTRADTHKLQRASSIYKYWVFTRSRASTSLRTLIFTDTNSRNLHVFARGIYCHQLVETQTRGIYLYLHAEFTVINSFAKFTCIYTRNLPS